MRSVEAIRWLRWLFNHPLRLGPKALLCASEYAAHYSRTANSGRLHAKRLAALTGTTTDDVNETFNALVALGALVELDVNPADPRAFALAIPMTGGQE